MANIQLYEPESIEGVVNFEQWTGRVNLYTKTVEARDQLHSHLQQVGYKVRDISEEPNLLNESKPSRQQQEKNGFELWTAELPEEVYRVVAECRTCDSLEPISYDISTKCGSCNEYLDKPFSQGDAIQFSKENHWPKQDPTVLVFKYDSERGIVYGYANPAECSQPCINTVLSYPLEATSKNWSTVLKQFPEFSLQQQNGTNVVAIPYSRDQPFDGTVFIKDRCAKIYRPQEVFLLDGQKHTSEENLTIPPYIGIYEAWHFMPIEPSDVLWRSILDRVGWGSLTAIVDNSVPSEKFGPIRDEFKDKVLRFVDEFTACDVEEVKKHITRATRGDQLIQGLFNSTKSTS